MAEITERMDKTIDSLSHEFAKVRTGRANANVLSDITIDYYGVPTPITQVAAVKVPEAHMLMIEPWDKSVLNGIVHALNASDLGITPSSDGTVIRLPFPAPTAPPRAREGMPRDRRAGTRLHSQYSSRRERQARA